MNVFHTLQCFALVDDRYYWCGGGGYHFNIVKGVGRANFRKAGHACGMNKKAYVLVNFEPLEDETTLNRM